MHLPNARFLRFSSPRQSVLLAVITALVLTGCQVSPPEHPFLPWDFEVNPQGNVEVFGLEIGESSMVDFRRLYDQRADLAIFRDPDGALSLEAYFGETAVGPLNAQVVLVADVGQEQLSEWASGSMNIDPTPSGARQMTMSDEAVRAAQHLPILSIHYAARADYSKALVERRFGIPDEVRIEPNEEENIEYWLYPQRGLMIILDEDGRDVFQYINPRNFNALEAVIAHTLE